jgi:L-threonylcarbamoyladenylate synthase
MKRDTKIYDVSCLDEQTIRRAQVLCEDDAIAQVETAMEYVSAAGRVIADGGLVVFPTETVYGLGADAFNESAVRAVYEAKGRPSDNPMIVHIARASDVSLLSDTLTPGFVRLVDQFWPGPLTIILPKKDSVPSTVTGGLDTVAIRLPDEPAAIELIRVAGCPVAAPSANLSGSPSPTKASHVIKDLDGLVDVILAGGDCRVGIESTVLDLTSETPTILRPGILSAAELSEVLGKEVVYDSALFNDTTIVLGRDSRLRGNDKDTMNRPLSVPIAASEPQSLVTPKSPGMKYKHYAPKAEMLVVEGIPENVRAEVLRLAALNEKLGLDVGVLLFDEKTYIEAAHDFYAELRALDDQGKDMIIAGALSGSSGVGLAVMNRMMRSAGYNIVKV